MGTTTAHGHEAATWQVDEVMEIAARLSGRDAVSAIHVALGTRPTYEDLLRYRRLAEENDLTFYLLADSIVFRPRIRTGPDGAEAVPRGRWCRWWRSLRAAACGRRRQMGTGEASATSVRR